MAVEEGSFSTTAYCEGSTPWKWLNFGWMITNKDTARNEITIYYWLVSDGVDQSPRWQLAHNFYLEVAGQSRAIAYDNMEKQYVYDLGQYRYWLKLGTVVADGYVTLAGGTTFSAYAQANIYYYYVTYSGEGTWTLPTLSIPPYPPTSVTVSGGDSSNKLLKDNAKVTVSWSGATSGTYTIQKYIVEMTTNNWASARNIGELNTSNTSGSLSNINISSYVNGGDVVRFRVTMVSTAGTEVPVPWSGSYTVYTLPSPPSVVTAPTRIEIDETYSVSWGSATAGSEAIAGFQAQRLILYSASQSFSDWVNISNSLATSVPQSSPRTVIGTSAENSVFYYRVRTYDVSGHYSAWSNTVSTTVYVNSPSVPRK